jgi:hypothetical protein
MADLQPHKSGRIWLDLVVAGCAVLISLASFWVAFRASQTQERLLSASVWPYLQAETSDFSPIDFSLQNAGVGPARLRWATLYYRGKAYASVVGAFAACCGAKHLVLGDAMTQYLQQRVLIAGQTIVYIRVPKKAAESALYTRLDRERRRFYLRACYCSVLDECWLFDERKSTPQPVKVCPPAETPVFRG